ncbi:hypothetical protein SAMN05216285_0974 [Natrinema salifodinae]|uniref:Uncharacterized protein n=1 Tax=Natrinema salifodinae TaxID=1202768 RepID=A0A1I0MHC4_9EURY|nr:hypothetical protein SAMN05216285_0974 [Natrinema salifodinae]
MTSEWTGSTAASALREISVSTAWSGVATETNSDDDNGDGHSVPGGGSTDTVTTAGAVDRLRIDGPDRRHRSIGTIDPARLADRFALRIRNRYAAAEFTFRVHPRPRAAARPSESQADASDGSFLPAPADESETGHPPVSSLSDSPAEDGRSPLSAAWLRSGAPAVRTSESRTIARSPGRTGPMSDTQSRSDSGADTGRVAGVRFETVASAGSGESETDARRTVSDGETARRPRDAPMTRSGRPVREPRPIGGEGAAPDVGDSIQSPLRPSVPSPTATEDGERVVIGSPTRVADRDSGARSGSPTPTATDALERRGEAAGRPEDTTGSTARFRHRERTAPFGTAVGIDAVRRRVTIGELADPAAAIDSRSAQRRAGRRSSPRHSAAYTVLVDEPDPSRSIERRGDAGFDTAPTDDTDGEGRSRSAATVTRRRSDFGRRLLSGGAPLDSARSTPSRPSTATVTDGDHDSPGGDARSRSVVTTDVPTEHPVDTDPDSSDRDPVDDCGNSSRKTASSGPSDHARVTADVRRTDSSVGANDRRLVSAETADGCPVSPAPADRSPTAGRAASESRNLPALSRVADSESRNGSSRPTPRSSSGLTTSNRRSVEGGRSPVDGERPLDRSTAPAGGLSNSFARRIRTAHAADPETSRRDDGPQGRSDRRFAQVIDEGGLETAITTTRIVTQFRSSRPFPTAVTGTGIDTDAGRTGTGRSRAAQRSVARSVSAGADVAIETQTESASSLRGSRLGRAVEASNGDDPVGRARTATDATPTASASASVTRAEPADRDGHGARPQETTATPGVNKRDGTAENRDGTAPAETDAPASGPHDLGPVSSIPRSARRRRRNASNRPSKPVITTGGPTAPLTPRVATSGTDSISSSQRSVRPSSGHTHSVESTDRCDSRPDPSGRIQADHSRSANGNGSVLGSPAVRLADSVTEGGPTDQNRGELTRDGPNERRPTDDVGTRSPVERQPVETQSRSTVDRRPHTGGRRSEFDATDDRTRFDPDGTAFDGAVSATRVVTVADPNWAPSQRATRFDTDAPEDSIGAAVDSRPVRPQTSGMTDLGRLSPSVRRRRSVASAGPDDSRSSSDGPDDVAGPMPTSGGATVRASPLASGARTEGRTVTSETPEADPLDDGERRSDLNTRAIVASDTVGASQAMERSPRDSTSAQVDLPSTATERQVATSTATRIDGSVPIVSGNDNEITKYKIDSKKVNGEGSERNRMNSSSNRPALVYRDPTPSVSARAGTTGSRADETKSAGTSIIGESARDRFADAAERSHDSRSTAARRGLHGRTTGSTGERDDGTVRPADRRRGNAGGSRQSTNEPGRGRPRGLANTSSADTPQRVGRIDGSASGRKPASEQPSDPDGHDRGRRDARDRSEPSELPWDGNSLQFEADVDRLVERLYRKIERKQRVERERRGF